MVIFSLVASHRTVDLNTVARLSAGVGALPPALVQGGGLQGVVALSTCNRLELYAEAPGSPEELEESLAHITQSIAATSGLDPEFVADSFQLHTGQEVSEHLFTVVSGLESAVVGEREIAGQVRRALAMAREQRTASGELIRLFEAAARTARTVGTQTSLGDRGRSIVSVALDLAEDVATEDWADTRVLVFGTGAYAGAAMAALTNRGCREIRVYSASGRAAEFTAKRGGTPISREQLPEAMAAADLVIGCSGGSAPLSAAVMPEGPRVVVDLALTRDFDPSVADVPGVELITLESVRLAAPEETVESVQAARRIVAESVREFAEQRSERSVDGAIVALRQHTMDVLEQEMDKVRHQYGCGAQADQLEFAMRRMLRSLLHRPMVNARRLAAQGRAGEFVAAVEAMYDLEVPAAPASQDDAEASCPVTGRLPESKAS